MSRNKKNLKMQMLEKLDSLNRIGEKKDKEGGGCNRACGVHSLSSLRTYRSSICTFADWMKSHHSEVKRMSDISTEIVNCLPEMRAEINSYISERVAKLGEGLTEIGINEQYEEYFITDYENVTVALGDIISEYSSVAALNKLAQRLEELSDADADKLGAVLECESCTSVSEVIDLLDELDEFDLLPDVTDDKALGHYYAEEYCCIDIPKHILPFFDFEAYGRAIRLESSCTYTTYGFLLDNR